MPKGIDRLPGQLASNQAYLDWYHRSVKGKPLCGTILGRMIHGGKDHITSKEQERLWDHYNKMVLQVAEGRKADKLVSASLVKKEICELQLKLDVSNELEVIFPQRFPPEKS